MKPSGWWLMGGVLLVMGCVEHLPLLPQGAPKPEPKQVVRRKKTPVPVTADQVNPTNANKTAEDLRRELEQTLASVPDQSMSVAEDGKP